MTKKRWMTCAALLSLAAAPAAAQTGGFITTLGADTVAIERFTRTGNRLEGEILGKVPSVIVRSYTIEFGADGRTTRAQTIQRRPGETAPLLTTTATFTRDSIQLEVRRDTGVTRRAFAYPGAVIAVPAGPGQSWAITEILAERLRASRSDSVHYAGYFVGTTAQFWISWTRMGRDSVRIRDLNLGLWYGRLGAGGRLESVTPISGTQQFAARRISAPDIAAVATAWRAREQQTAQAGLLSPRDTVRASTAGAALWIDYSRPSKRGRVVYGSPIVPWGEVWRTGANAATQFRSDRAIEIGGVLLQPGLYTLWTIPQQSGGWKLLINSETGQWGTAHNGARDVYQLDMTTSALPAVVERFTISVVPTTTGGTLHLDWDRTRASIPFTVR